MTHAQLAPAILTPLIVWIFYSRFRRNVGRQKLRPKRMIASVGIMMLFPCLFAFPLAHIGAAALWFLVCGLAAGGIIGVIGCKLTRFEIIAGEKFYTPNSYLGVAVPMLLIACFAYGLFPLYWPAGNVPPAIPVWVVCLVIGLNLGYHISYHAGVFFALKTAGRSPETPA